MEGLIPFIYNAIKRKRSRMYYRSLSTGVARGFDTSDFHRGENLQRRSAEHEFGSFDEGKMVKYEPRDKQYQFHQRHRSMENFPGEDFSPDIYGGPHKKEMRRLGSLRIFSCSGGF
ncbi:hypothetical protein LUZ60_001920 [Juncus effusus]|nr:hypothetical protein LUZ60_001920 [Juncus effusus]